MLPTTMKKPVWLAPLCVADITLGLFLLFLVTVPGFAPDLKEKASRRGLTAFLLAAASINIVGPVAALWYHCRESKRIERGETGGDEWKA